MNYPRSRGPARTFSGAHANHPGIVVASGVGRPIFSERIRVMTQTAGNLEGICATRSQVRFGVAGTSRYAKGIRSGRTTMNKPVGHSSRTEVLNPPSLPMPTYMRTEAYEGRLSLQHLWVKGVFRYYLFWTRVGISAGAGTDAAYSLAGIRPGGLMRGLSPRRTSPAQNSGSRMAEWHCQRHGQRSAKAACFAAG